MRRCRPLLGTFVEIDSDCTATIEAGFAAITRVHERMSAHQPDSELSLLNRSTPSTPVQLAEETLTVLRRAIFWAEASNGRFDPLRAGRLAIERGALPLHPGQPRPPADSCWSDLRIDGATAWLERPGCVDLGGIAKGHAVDAALAAMRDAGAGFALVNAGGDMAAFGQPQRVIVVDPATRRPRLSLTLDGSALATSAGLPDGEGGLDHRHLPGALFASVTVEAPTCIDADALTKILFAGGSDSQRLLALASARAFALNARGDLVELGLEAAA